MQFEFEASKREEQGSSASRRLRRAGRVPGIIYGGDGAAQPIAVDHNEIYHLLQKEAFHSSLLNIKLDGAAEEVVLRDAQWHSFRPQVLHVDFLRVTRGETLVKRVPLHFINDEVCPGVKLEGGIVSHVMNEIEVECLPRNLPEFIEVDLKELALGHSMHVAELKLPEGVELGSHMDGESVVATVLRTKAEIEEGSEEEQSEQQ